ncbi:MAG: YihA family ribosome biogenesis GTP-binding protein [Solobacterium sp.]|nr:YihA family ribosome biogenesis GTP-binding protein [Solobacterium sp.]
MYRKAEYLASSAYESQWPVSDLPEVIFAGRSNAGKSSLINALTNRKNLAYSGKTPGKTQLLNFFLIEDRVVFVDAPGYGYARGGDQSARVFGRLMEPYFRRREQLKAMVIVLDIRRTPSPEDIQMVEYAKQAHLAILGACTKADKLSNNQISAQLKIIADTLELGKQNLIPCSSLKKTGIEAVEARIEEYLNH